MLRVLILLLLLVVSSTVEAKYWNGSAWVDTVAKRWSGSAWETVAEKWWDGDSWEVVNASGGGSGLLGINTIEDSYFTGFTAPGEIRIFRAQAITSGPVSTFNFYQVGGNNWLGVIYSDNAGDAGTLLAYTASNAGVDWGSIMWDTIALNTSINVVSGTWYWIGVQMQTNVDMQYKAKQSGVAKSYTTTYGSPPTTWPTESDTDLNWDYAGGVMYAD